MNAIALTNFPAIEDGSDIDFSFFYSGAQAPERYSSHYFVYEKKRDFLSAPRAFVVLEITVNDEHAVELDADFTEIFFPRDNPSNFYQLPNTSILDAENPDTESTEQVYCIVAENISIGLHCVSISLVETFYHLRSSRQALAQFLARSYEDN